jgi:two-component system chemotaxis response regulator CheY
MDRRACAAKPRQSAMDSIYTPDIRTGHGHDYQDVVALLVEDNDFLRQLVLRVLHELGIQDIRHAREGKHGLRAFRDRPAHVVIVEFGQDPDEACGLMRRLQKLKPVAKGATGLIALLPRPDRDAVMRAHDAGAEAVVAEPIAPGELGRHVEAIIQRHAGPAADGANS